MYIVACLSRISGFQSVCRDDNGWIIFQNKEDAEEYARKQREKMGINYHYWVEEY